MDAVSFGAHDRLEIVDAAVRLRFLVDDEVVEAVNERELFVCDLETRRTETNEQIAARLEIAHDEFTFARRFDYLVINEEAQPQQAVDDLAAIVRAERYRIHRVPDIRLKELEDS